MACITSLEEDTTTGTWHGRSNRTNETRTFKTLDDYKTYTKSLEDKGTYCPDVEPQRNIKYTKGTNTTSSGFLEFRPRDPVTQAKYDAMSDTWEGVASSEAAVARGDYSLDSAEKIRKDLRSLPPPPKLEMPRAAPHNCVIQ